jgi:type VI secretion system protein ImpH
LTERLLAHAREFDFFQTIRLLEWVAWEARSQGLGHVGPIGEDSRPDDEVVRFRVPATLAFAPSPVVALTGRKPEPEAPLTNPWQMEVAFLGMIGPSGVLPTHYTAEAITRVHGQDPVLKDFLDIFQHRAVSLFYRAWRKYRLAFELERSLREQSHPIWPGASGDPFSSVFRCLVGLGTSSLADRMRVADETIVYYCGHFTHAARPALSLARLLEDYYQLPAEVEQFSGRWLNLPPEQRTSMPTRLLPRGRHCILGRESIVGSRVWDVQSKFRIRLGPMTYRRFTEFFPGGTSMNQLADLVRLYARPALEFDVQPVLRRDEVPTAQLGTKTMLGRNGWLASRPRSQDAAEAVFRPSI